MRFAINNPAASRVLNSLSDRLRPVTLTCNRSLNTTLNRSVSTGNIYFSATRNTNSINYINPGQRRYYGNLNQGREKSQDYQGERERSLNLDHRESELNSETQSELNIEPDSELVTNLHHLFRDSTMGADSQMLEILVGSKDLHTLQAVTVASKALSLNPTLLESEEREKSVSLRI
jgi:hypothetical protein